MSEKDKMSSVDEFLTRGVAHIYPNAEVFKEKLLTNEALSFYLGIDPTGSTLHLGHVIPLLKLSALQKLGHKVVLLIGDFTAMIGDPDKLSVRVPLSHGEVLENAKLYKKQAGLFLDFGGENPAEMKYNSEWFSKMNFADVLALASNVSVGQILERDMFQKRISDGRPIYLHEFLYPLMQGYDSVILKIDGEVGGSDQIFNMLVGRHMEKQMLGKEKFVLGTKLLEDSTGAKMGKTTGNMVALTDDPADIFGKVMSWADGMIIPALELVTRVPEQEIDSIKKQIESGANPKDAKMRLAYEVVALIYGEKKAEDAREQFVKTFQKKELPDDMKETGARIGDLLMNVVIAVGMAKSKSDFRRLVGEGAVSVFADGKEMKISEAEFFVDRDIIAKIGKKRFLKINIGRSE